VHVAENKRISGLIGLLAHVPLSRKGLTGVVQGPQAPLQGTRPCNLQTFDRSLRAIPSTGETLPTLARGGRAGHIA